MIFGIVVIILAIFGHLKAAAILAGVWFILWDISGGDTA
jgi:hypothetical protein